MTNQTTYISLGTVRVRSDLAGGSTNTVIFTPKNDFCISHADRNYVALVPAKEKSKQPGILARCDRDKDFCLDFDGKNAGTKKTIEAAVKHKHLLDAATKQCAVKIEVAKVKCQDSPDKGCEDTKWTLVAITIPAASKTR